MSNVPYQKEQIENLRFQIYQEYAYLIRISFENPKQKLL